MKRCFSFLLALMLLFCVPASAEMVFLKDYGFYFTLPDDWVYQDSEITDEYKAAGVVYGIDAHTTDDALTMWLEIHVIDGESVAADKLGVMELEGHIADMREYYPDMAYYIVGNTPFIYYTATDADGAYLTTYTWSGTYQYSFIFFAKELTDEVRTRISEVMQTYKPL